MSERPDRSSSVIGPAGQPLAVEKLSPRNTIRWIIRRKAEIEVAVRNGLIGLGEACERYRPPVREIPGISNEGRACLTYGMLRRVARCDKGISSVEFVLILPILMLFLFSIISFGSLLYIHVNMENAAREAVRRLAVADSVECTAAGGTTAPCTSATVVCGVDPITGGTAEDFACTYLANWSVGFEVEAGPDATDCTELTVTVRLPDASLVALADVFGFFDGRTLSAEVAVREEEACS